MNGYRTAANIFSGSFKIETDIMEGYVDGISNENIERRLDTVVQGKPPNVAYKCRSRAAHLR
jgi:hypothetical protein